jgi:hypothetical protein
MALPNDGAVPTSKGDLYVVPAGFAASVRSIHISNSSGTARTCTLYLNLSGTSRAISAVNMALAADGVAISEAPIELFNGAKIEGVASGSGVSFVISGTEKRTN